MREMVAWLCLTPATAHDAVSTKDKSGRTGGRQERRKDTSANSIPDAGIYYKLDAEFKERNGHSHTSHGGGGTFRAKVQAISRIKMRLRNRAAFSASR